MANETLKPAAAHAAYVAAYRAKADKKDEQMVERAAFVRNQADELQPYTAAIAKAAAVKAKADRAQAKVEAIAGAETPKE
jgi:hypothetical protein